MECREALERLSDYQDGGPDSAAAGSVGAHLRECAGCAETARSLAVVREGLRRLPPVAAPPELMERVREAVAREGGASAPVPPGTEVPAGARSLLSRLRIPLEAAAAVLLVASIWWYQKGTPTESVPGSPQAPAGTAAPAPKADPGPFPRLPEKAAISPSRESKPAGQPSQAPPAPAAPAGAAAGKADFASLPAGTPEPKPRDYSPAELPAAPAVRASSESPRVLAATPARPPGPLPYGREVVLDVTPEARESAGERIAAAARRLGGGVERVERDTPGGYVAAVRVLLPEPAAPVFLSELDRIGKVPPEGKPADSEAPAGPARGTVAYTVRIRVR